MTAAVPSAPIAARGTSLDSGASRRGGRNRSPAARSAAHAAVVTSIARSGQHRRVPRSRRTRGAARQALQRRHGPRRAERGGARVAHRSLEPPAPVRPMPEPHHDRSSATRHCKRREVGPAPPRHHARPADPSARVVTDDAHAPPGRSAALKRDYAAPVFGHSSSHRPLPRARPQECPPRPERLAGRGRAPRHG